MKFKELLKNLNELAEKNPECLEYEAITSIDSEGNGYNPVDCIPDIGHFVHREQEWIPEEYFEEYIEEYGWTKEELKCNAICIN